MNPPGCTEGSPQFPAKLQEIHLGLRHFSRWIESNQALLCDDSNGFQGQGFAVFEFCMCIAQGRPTPSPNMDSFEDPSSTPGCKYRPVHIHSDTQKVLALRIKTWGCKSSKAAGHHHFMEHHKTWWHDVRFFSWLQLAQQLRMLLGWCTARTLKAFGCETIWALSPWSHSNASHGHWQMDKEGHELPWTSINFHQLPSTTWFSYSNSGKQMKKGTVVLKCPDRAF